MPIAPYLGSCSTFQLEHRDELIVGHNLDDQYDVGGAIIINKRGVSKRGISWSELVSSKQPAMPSPTWRSRFGSASFNTRGRDFADGGLNEAGLAIWEMSLMPSERYPADESKPTLYMMNWIQYQLDMHESVGQVIESADRFNLDGWFWHFFVADRFGSCATIEFIDGSLVAHTGSTLPIKVLCNAGYAAEVEKYTGKTTLPENPSDFQKRFWADRRFETAARMIQGYETDGTSGIVEYGFETLDRIVPFDWNQWHIVAEPRKRRVRYRTKRNRDIRSVNLDSFDLSSETSCQMLNIDAGRAGDTCTLFRDFDSKANRRFIESDILGICDVYPQFEKWIESQGATAEQLIERMASYPSNEPDA